MMTRAPTPYGSCDERKRFSGFREMMKEIIKKSQRKVVICDTFRLKRMCQFTQKITRSDVGHRRANRWTDGNRCSRVAHSALRGNGYHDALGGRGARALRFDRALCRRAGDAAPPIALPAPPVLHDHGRQLALDALRFLRGHLATTRGHGSLQRLFRGGRRLGDDRRRLLGHDGRAAESGGD